MQQIFKKFKTIALDLAVAHDNGMTSCAMMGYQGFKRWHEMLSEAHWCNSLKVSRACIDCTNAACSLPTFTVQAAPLESSMKSHLDMSINFLSGKRDELTPLNIQFFNKTGVLFPVGQCMAECVYKVLVEMERLRHRFQSVEWNEHDVRVVSSRLHNIIRDGKLYDFNLDEE